MKICFVTKVILVLCFNCISNVFEFMSYERVSYFQFVSVAFAFARRINKTGTKAFCYFQLLVSVRKVTIE